MIEFYRRRPVLAVFAGAYSVAVLVMGVRAGEPSRIWWWLGAIPFLAWVASPIVVGLWLAEALKALSTRLIFFAALVGVGIYGYADQWHVMFVGPADAQNALIMVFGPLLQWAAIGLVFLLSFVGDRLVFKS